MDAEDMKRHYVIRFINTRLVGCEYVIRDDRTTYIVADRHTIESEQKRGSDPAVLYVLDDSITTRFDIVYSAGMSLPRLISDKIEKTLNFNQRIDVGGVQFALRSEDSEWQALDEDQSIEEAHASHAMPSEAKPRALWIKIPLMSVLMLVIIVGGILALYQRDDSSVADLNQALGGKPHQFNTFIGRDNQLYIFAQEAQSSRWAWQSLIKNNFDKKATVLSAKTAEENILREIAARWPLIKLHALRFDDPSRPEIILSQERTTLPEPTQLNSLVSELITLFPWAHTFSFSYISDDNVAGSAEQGLLGIVPYFIKRINADSVTFTVRGELNDGELNAIKEFIDAFRSKWRGEYVQFDIELEADRFKGKSYLYGNESFVKVTSEQWYFPENRLQR